MFFTAYVLSGLSIVKLSAEGQTVLETENLIEKLQHSNQTFCLSCVSLIGLWTTRPWLVGMLSSTFMPVMTMGQMQNLFCCWLKSTEAKTLSLKELDVL